jgi:Pyocin activator protein PrtN
MNTAFLLMAQYSGKAIIPIEDVCRDYFSHLNATKLVKKISGEIAIPLVRIESSQKCAKGVHLTDQRFRVKAFSFCFKHLDGGACLSSIASHLPWYCVAGLDEFVPQTHVSSCQVQTQGSVLHFRRLGLDGPDRSFGGDRVMTHGITLSVR